MSGEFLDNSQSKDNETVNLTYSPIQIKVISDPSPTWPIKYIPKIPIY